MRQVAITGGKGGTGKSTVAVLMAGELSRQGQKVVLVDCDVECPNDYLLVGEKLEKPVKKVYADFPVLDKNKCQKCGKCVEVCQDNAVFQAPGEYPVFIKNLCSGCGACWMACPYGAIGQKKEEVGQIFINVLAARHSAESLAIDQDDIYLITGQAKPGLEETGPVVAKIKEFALEFAEKQKANVVLLDTAAGTHCPVINALLDTDLAYAVTEPTPMGAYDLKVILDLCAKLGVPAQIIVNQFNMANLEPIQNIAAKRKIKIASKIPYSKNLLKAYTKGRLQDINLENINKLC